MRLQTVAAFVVAATALACEDASVAEVAADVATLDVTDDRDVAPPVDASEDAAALEDVVPLDAAEAVDVRAESADVFGDPDVEGLPAAPVRGTVRIFGPPGGPLAGATIRVLEHPGLSAVTDEDGRFELAEVPAGYVTLVMEAEGFPENQLGTQRHAGGALEDCDFQAVSDGIYDLFALLTESEPSKERCQISTTVTRYFEGGLPTVHGEPGATASLGPASPDHPGPIYFNEDVLPTPGLTETSVDGGVVWTNVEPGEYVLTASKVGVTFEPVKIRCRAGVLVNAGPPRGLQGREPGGPY